ncbi:unnamed protein product [Effrenium voratum]|nr:unnamed protein product [Effrenium voratum]
MWSEKLCSYVWTKASDGKVEAAQSYSRGQTVSQHSVSRHQVHSSGELQRLLRKETEAERKIQRKQSETPEDVGEKKQRDLSRKPSLSAGQSGTDLGTGSQSASLRRFSNASESAPPPIPEVADESRFDPLVWLSDRLKKSATGDAGKFREKIKERVLQQIRAAEAAEAERARAEAEAKAADDGEITSIAEVAGEGS